MAQEQSNNEENQKINPSTIWLLLVLGGGGTGGVAGFLSGAGSHEVDDHTLIHQEHTEIWKEIRKIKDELGTIKADLNAEKRYRKS